MEIPINRLTLDASPESPRRLGRAEGTLTTFQPASHGSEVAGWICLYLGVVSEARY